MKRLLPFLLLITAARAQNTAKFPGAVPTTADLGVAANRAETTLTTGINATATSIPVASSSGFKAGSFVTIDNEIIAVCSIPDGTHLNAGVSSCPNVDGRGVDTANGGGAAASHLAAAKVQGRITAKNINQAAAEIRAIATKLNVEMASVRDYGAVGDGSTDDATAIQAAIAANPGKTILFPPGTYRTTASLVVSKQNTRLLGHNATIYFTGTGPILKLTDDGGANVFGVGVSGLYLKGTASATDGLWIHGSHRILIENVEVHDVSAAGARTGFSVGGTWVNFTVSLNSAVWVQQPAFGMFMGDGALPNIAGDPGKAPWTTAQTIINPTIQGVSDTGILLSQALFCHVQGGSSEQHGGWGLTVGPNAKNSTITATDFEANTSGDLYIWGLETTIVNAQSDKLLRVDSHAIGTKVRGGLYYSITIDSGATGTSLDAVSYANDLGSGPGVLTDNGTDTRLIGLIQRPLNRVSHFVETAQQIEVRANHNIVPGVVNADDAPLIMGTWTFTSAGATSISPRAVLSSGGPWRALFIGSWVNDWEGGGLVQPAFVAELTTASPTMTIGSRTVTFSISGNRFVGICNQPASKVGFIGVVIVSMQSLGTAGTTSWKIAGALIAGGDITGAALSVTGGTVTGKFTINAAVAGDTAANLQNTSATGYGLRSLGGGSDCSHYLLSVATSGGTAKYLVDGCGHQVTLGTAPSVSSCGTSPSITGDDNTGRVTTGSASPTACTITFSATWAIAPSCVFSTSSSSVTVGAAVSTTAAVLTFSSALNSGTVFYQCRQHQ